MLEPFTRLSWCEDKVMPVDHVHPPEEPLTGGRRGDLARAAAQQLLLVTVFESPDLLAHCRLGEVVERGGTLEGAGLDYVAQHLERLELHEAPSFEGRLVLASVGAWRNRS